MSSQIRRLEPAGKPTIAGDIEVRLRHDILHGVLAPGSRLNLEFLRDELEVGLSPLREAVTRLVVEGLIEVVAQRGYTVTPISVENLREVSALRIELEPYALRRSIANGGLDWESDVMAALHRLNRSERRPDEPATLAAWETANNAFHRTLIERCDMPLLMKIHGGIVSMNDRYRHIYLNAAGVQREVIDEHSAIAHAAIDRRPDEAAALLTTHIQRSTDNLTRLIKAALPEAADT